MRKSLRHWLGRDRAADVAALAIEEPHARVLGQRRLPVFGIPHAVAAARDRRADEFRGDDRRFARRSSTRRLFTQFAWIVAGEHDRVGNLAVGEELHEPHAARAA